MTDSPVSEAIAGRAALCIEYNGAFFNGWQSQKCPRTTTVQETLEKAISEVADHPVSLICAGRTDAGVHATGQVVHFDYRFSRPESAWVRGGNSILPPEVAIRWARHVDTDFHARFSATARRYRYVIYNHPVKPAILSGMVSHYHTPLDTQRMHEAGQALLGEQDFSSYRGAACQSKTPMRNVIALNVARQGELVFIEIEANAFLLHMVRNIVGVLIEIGEGKKPVSWAGELLELHDRSRGGITAAPDGLYLAGVSYPASFELPHSPEGPVFLYPTATGNRAPK